MEVLTPGQSIRAKVTLPLVKQLLLLNYGIDDARVTQLEGYDDYNYHIQIDSEMKNPYIGKVSEYGYVLKILNSLDSKNPEFIEGQHELIFFLDTNGIKVPVPTKNINGNFFSIENLGGSSGNIVRLLKYIPGKTLASCEVNDSLLYNVGEFVGKLSKCIKVFSHPGYKNRKSIWMLESVPSIKNFMCVLSDEHKINIVTQVLQEFHDNVLQNLHSFKRGLIHGDLNEHNIIIEDNKVSALLDFGDSHNSTLIFEVAIAICYMLLKSNQLDCPKKILEGYFKHCEMDSKERMILKICICARLCQTLVLGLYSYTQDPSNTYVLSSQKNGWQLLMEIHKWNNQQLDENWNLTFN